MVTYNKRRDVKTAEDKYAIKMIVGGLIAMAMGFFFAKNTVPFGELPGRVIGHIFIFFSGVLAFVVGTRMLMGNLKRQRNANRSNELVKSESIRSKVKKVE